MKAQGALLATLAVTALALAAACQNTAEGVKEDSRQNAEKARLEAEAAAKKVGGVVAEGAKDVGEQVKEAAKEVGSEVSAAKQTVDVKAALMMDKSIDASHIDVETDSDTRTLTLKGTVPTAAQKAAVESLARKKAEGYKIRSLLTVAK